MQQQLQTSREGADFELATWLRQLCENLTALVGGDTTRIAIDVQADAVTVSSAVAMNMGVIVNELVVNALKHAFPADTVTGRVMVTYRVEGHGWRLTVSDNGVGKPNGDQSPAATGSGTGIVAALVRQLDGRIETSTGLNGVGTRVSITNTNDHSSLPANKLRRRSHGQGPHRGMRQRKSKARSRKPSATPSWKMKARPIRSKARCRMQSAA